MKTTTILSEELQQKIRTELSKPLYLDFDDRGECLSDESVELILEGKADEVIDTITELNAEYISDLERNRIVEVLEEYETEIEDETGESYESVESELITFFSEDCHAELNLKDLFRQKVPVRIELHSNYDCINSHWLESSEYSAESYYFDAIKALNLNPAFVKEFLLTKRAKVTGSWKNIPGMNGKECVSLNDLWKEDINRCSSANLLTIVGTVNLYDIYQAGEIKEIIIPKGNHVGFFSSFNGGGSTFECPLLRDMRIKLNDKSKGDYDYWSMSMDGSYSIREVYGVGIDFFDSEIKIVG